MTNHPLARLHQAPIGAVHCSGARPPAGTGFHGAALLFRSQTDASAAEILDLSRRALRRLQGVSAGTRACANDGRSSCIFPVVYRAALPEVQSPGVSRASKRPLFHFGETNSPCCASATDRRDRSRAVVNVTSLRSRAAHRLQCDGPRWRRGCRSTSRPGGGCPESARPCSRW
jgi:hypothetical protein